ncbi:MAG: hypothetical protein DME26_07180 [Verrucomicrobia bacterium]|nr:MAG: hypothetical protein DME26_07180 [Verrucomicrobiota bacterium]
MAEKQRAKDKVPAETVARKASKTSARANLAGASLLRIARSALVNRRFGLFVSPADGPAYGAFLK